MRNPYCPPLQEPRRSQHAQLHVPPLTPHEALRFVSILDKLSRAIWRAHGAGMSVLLQREVDAHIVRSPRARRAHAPLLAQIRAIGDDDDFPF